MYAGDEIIQKGAPGDVFYMIKHGTVKVHDVGEKFHSHELKPGDYFGERALMTNEPRAATVSAISKTVLMTLDKVAFQKHLGSLQEVLDQNLNMRVLSSVKLFEKLTETERVKLCKSFVPEIFPANNTIIRQGEKGTKFYILLDGTANVLDKDVLVSTLRSGDYFGEMALLDDEVRKATIKAVTECKCVFVDRATFIKILGSLKHLMDRETHHRKEALEYAHSHQPSPAKQQHKESPSGDKKAISSVHDSHNDAPQMTSYEFSNLTHVAMLGSGTFGKVTLVQDKVTKKLFALKAMYKSEIVAHKQQTNIMNEKNVMMNCNHPFVLKLFQTFRDAKSLYMLLEFVQGGELFSVIHKPNRDGVPDSSAKVWMCTFFSSCFCLFIVNLQCTQLTMRAFVSNPGILFMCLVLRCRSFARISPPPQKEHRIPRFETGKLFNRQRRIS